MVGEFVDKYDFVIVDDIVFVFGKEFMCVQILVYVVYDGGVFWIIE